MACGRGFAWDDILNTEKGRVSEKKRGKYMDISRGREIEIVRKRGREEERGRYH